MKEFVLMTHEGAAKEMALKKLRSQLELALVCSMTGLQLPKGRRLGPEKKSRPCINCGTEHMHNNSFCSVKCCKEYKK